MSFKILVTEDEKNIREGLADVLAFEGYAVETACNGAEALKKYKSVQPDLILLDVMMPEVNGFDVCRNIRNTDPVLPIIILTAKSEEIDKVLGLELGADDYVTKPFSPRELCARIAARLRTASLPQSGRRTAKTFPFGTWTVDPENQKASGADGTEYSLSQREVRLLSLFAENRDIILDRHTIMKNVWDNVFNCSRTLDQHIVVLRRKLESDLANPARIETVYGRGYRFRE